MDSNIELKKFSSLALKELELSKKIIKWSYKDLADYMIQNVWGEQSNRMGTEKSVVLDRVINILFQLDDRVNKQKNASKN